jgi:sucrose phosphorylase
MFDAVFNHMSASSDWFQSFLRGDPRYHDFFVTVEGEPDLSRVARPRVLPLLTPFHVLGEQRKVWTTFSADQVDLNFKNPEVFLAVVDALLFYVEKGAQFLRLDAIAYLWKEIGTICIHLPQTHRVIQLLRKILDVVAPRVLLITETNVPHAENLTYFGDGSDEAQLIYNFALPPLVLHALVTGNAEHLTRWAAGLRVPSNRVALLNFLASHDGIGLNPARGILSPAQIVALVKRTQDHGGFVSFKRNCDGSQSPYELNINYFDALSNPNDGGEPMGTQISRFLAAQSIMLALAGVPGIYFHSLFGSRNDRAGAEVSGIARRINREKLARAKLERELGDAASPRATIFARFKRLLAVRRAQPAFNPSSLQHVLELDSAIFGLLRSVRDSSQSVLCLHNVTECAVRIAFKLPGKANAHWSDLLGSSTQCSASGDKYQIRLSPYQVFWGRAC